MIGISFKACESTVFIKYTKMKVGCPLKLVTFVAIYPKRFVSVVVCPSLQQTSASPCRTLNLLPNVCKRLKIKAYLGMSKGFFCSLTLSNITRKIVVEIHPKMLYTSTGGWNQSFFLYIFELYAYLYTKQL